MLSKAELFGLGAALALALASRWQHEGAGADRCSLDGRAIEAVRRIDLVEKSAHGGEEAVASFCSYACALAWPGERPTDAWWRVRDEASGAPIDAALASFVASRAESESGRRERIHAFASWSEAIAHADAYGGTRIENPFARVSSAGTEARKD
jgi:hypothetical protein